MFSITAALWVTRTGPFGGWSEWLQLPYSNDAMVAFIAVIALFIIPNGERDPDTNEPLRLLDWPTAERIPWGMLLLFGAGITIATAFANSGLQSHRHALQSLATLPILLMIATICWPLLSSPKSRAIWPQRCYLCRSWPPPRGYGIDPMLRTIPAAMSALVLFMLPVATRNVVTFSTGRFSIKIWCAKAWH